MFYTIENEYLIAEISDLGATLHKFIDKKTNTDMVLGFDEEEGYIKYSGTNIGASIGRNANRIENSCFTIDGNTYHLTSNEYGKNQLHGGGVNGFAFKRWDVKQKNEAKIVLTYLSADGEEGFPGNLNVEVTYELKDNNLIWSYEGDCDKDTVFNMTNHSYINLGDDNILNHKLMITTDKYSPVNAESITLDEVVNVKDSPYDFSKETLVNDNLSRLECGIDNNYVWENMDDKLMAKLSYKDLTFNVYSDLPDMHLYTAYYLNGEQGKYNKTYGKYQALCLECQYYPNAINYNSYIKPILKKGEKMSHYIKYEIISK